MISQAKDRGMAVHPYVLRLNEEISSKSFNGNSTKETLYFVCCLEIDGIFTDYPDQTRLAVELSYVNPTICADICPTKFIKTGDNYIIPRLLNSESNSGYSNILSQSYFMFFIVMMVMIWEPINFIFGKTGKSLE